MPLIREYIENAPGRNRTAQNPPGAQMLKINIAINYIIFYKLNFIIFLFHIHPLKKLLFSFANPGTIPAFIVFRFHK